MDQRGRMSRCCRMIRLKTSSTWLVPLPAPPSYRNHPGKHHAALLFFRAIPMDPSFHHQSPPGTGSGIVFSFPPIAQTHAALEPWHTHFHNSQPRCSRGYRPAPIYFLLSKLNIPLFLLRRCTNHSSLHPACRSRTSLGSSTGRSSRTDFRETSSWSLTITRSTSFAPGLRATRGGYGVPSKRRSPSTRAICKESDFRPILNIKVQWICSKFSPSPPICPSL